MGFFRLLKKAPYLTACVMLLSIERIRAISLTIMKTAFFKIVKDEETNKIKKLSSTNLAELITRLCFNDE